MFISLSKANTLSGLTVYKKALSWGAGESVAQGQNQPRESRTMSVLLRCWSPQSSRSAPGVCCTASSGGKFFSRDGSSGSGRVYPQPGFKLRAVGRKDLAKQKCDREPGTNRTAFRSTRNRLKSHSISSKLSASVRETRQAACEQSSDPMGLAKTILIAKEEVPLLPLVSAYGLALWALHGKQSGDGAVPRLTHLARPCVSLYPVGPMGSMMKARPGT